MKQLKKILGQSVNQVKFREKDIYKFIVTEFPYLKVFLESNKVFGSKVLDLPSDIKNVENKLTISITSSLTSAQTMPVVQRHTGQIGGKTLNMNVINVQVPDPFTTKFNVPVDVRKMADVFVRMNASGGLPSVKEVDAFVKDQII